MTVLFFVNGLGALALASRTEFCDHEISPNLRRRLGLFGTVCLAWALVQSYYAIGERMGL